MSLHHDRYVNVAQTQDFACGQKILHKPLRPFLRPILALHIFSCPKFNIKFLENTLQHKVFNSLFHFFVWRYHPGQLFYIIIPWNNFFCIFVSFTQLIPPEDFLCNVAATGASLLANKPNNLLRQVISL